MNINSYYITITLSLESSVLPPPLLIISENQDNKNKKQKQLTQTIHNRKMMLVAMAWRGWGWNMSGIDGVNQGPATSVRRLGPPSGMQYIQQQIMVESQLCEGYLHHSYL
jgi:hypothetical protein